MTTSTLKMPHGSAFQLIFCCLEGTSVRVGSGVPRSAKTAAEVAPKTDVAVGANVGGKATVAVAEGNEVGVGVSVGPGVGV